LEYIGVECEITRDPAKIAAAERVIFPGVGAAEAAMANLNEFGLLEPIRETVASGKPFMGICLGSQIILERSEEGDVACIGLIPGAVKRFAPIDYMCKIPQMGWNTVEIKNQHPIFDGIEDSTEFYFVHSYYCAPSDDNHIIGETDYAGVRFASAVGYKNLIATQFHPERSGRIGLKMLENFSRWDGKC
jgi:glutamine amidotransferase